MIIVLIILITNVISPCNVKPIIKYSEHNNAKIITKQYLNLILLYIIALVQLEQEKPINLLKVP